jgi:zinc D-Ala-D-Ala carboxypeptidase
VDWFSFNVKIKNMFKNKRQVGNMKKLLVITACMLLLSGCSEWDSVKKKVPFLNKSDKETGVTNDNGQEESPSQTEKSEDELTLDALFFNDVIQVDGKDIIQNPENIMALVNKQIALPGDYTPEDLVRPNVYFSFGDLKIEKSLLRKEAGTALEEMFLEAQKAEVELTAVSGYRSYGRQKEVLDAEIGRVGAEKAVMAVAYPGQSEHQTGLAMDISSKSSRLELTEAFAETPEGKWLAENAHLFGFILRYPKGKEGITGYQFEPWHFRYVGLKAAETIYKKNWTLEEFFNEVKKI